jgi:hypothetical protein
MYDQYIGDVEVNLQGVLGRLKEDVDLTDFGVSSGVVEIHSLIGGTGKITIGSFMFQSSYYRANTSFTQEDISTLADGWEAFGFKNVSKSVDVINDTATFKGLGIDFNFDEIQITGEYTVVEYGDTVLSEKESSFYLTAAKKFEKYTAHVTYGGDMNDVGLDAVSMVPYGLSPEIDFLKMTTIETMNTFKVDSRFGQVGLRYDVSEGIALKIEVKRITDNLNDTSLTLARLAINTIF